jgi:arylsulfatase A-like enzyme
MIPRYLENHIMPKNVYCGKPQVLHAVCALSSARVRMGRSANCWLGLIVAVGVLQLPAPAGELPNIVVIYADDLGYGDVACNNPERGKIATPNIDALATAGMRFTDAHSSSGVCSPSRYTLLTGRYHWRSRLQRGIVGLWEEPLISADRLTLPGMLQSQGYRTACVGKWHLGWDWALDPDRKHLFKGQTDADNPVSPEHLSAWQHTFSQSIAGGPTSRGFDTYFGTDVPNWPPYCFIENDRTLGIPTEFLPTRLFAKNQASVQGPALADWALEPILPTLAARARAFIEQAAMQEQPYFLYMPLTSPHTPLAVNAPWQGRSGLNPYADLVMETDDVVGQIVRAIDQTEEAANTLVFFTSDNGCAPYIDVEQLESLGHYPSGPLRGYKSDAWEGGHRVPFVVRWPQRVPAGTVCDQLVHQADLLATCASIVTATVPPAAGEDSFDLTPLLLGGEAPVRQTAVSQSIQGLFALRLGNWKLIFGPGSGGWGKGSDNYPAQLYDLSTDIGEQHNRYGDQPELVRQLTAEMERVVNLGRSTVGPQLANDVPVLWQQFLPEGEPTTNSR